MPKLSVLMSVYNEECYLPLALGSLLAQSFEDFDIWLVDDGSTDRTPEIIMAYQQRDSRIRMLTHKSRQGLPISLNEAFQYTFSQYIARMDGDDLCDPDRFSRQLAFFESHPDVGVLGTGCHLIDKDGQVIGRYVPPETDTEIRCMMPKRNPMLHSSIIMRRRVLEQAGGYNPRFRYSQDYELWARVAPFSRFANLPGPLLEHRLHLDHVTQVSRARAIYSLRARLSWLQKNESRLSDWLGLVRPLPWLLLPASLSARLQRWYWTRTL